MSNRLVDWLFRWLRLARAPAATPVTAGTIILRLSRRRYQYQTLLWFLTQSVALFGILVFFYSDWFLRHFNPLGIFTFVTLGDSIFAGVLAFLSENVYDPATWPFNPFTEASIQILEWLGLALFFIQAAIRYLPIWLRLPYHATWYLIEPEGLRSYTGIWSRREIGIRYANVQALTLKRNPLQTLLGLADIEVRVAGGGHKNDDEKKASDSLLRFQDIENGDEIVQLIRDRLKSADPAPKEMAPAPQPSLVGAALELLDAARALRQEF